MGCLFEGRRLERGVNFSINRVIRSLGLCTLSNALMSWLLFLLPNCLVSGIPFCRSKFLRLSNSAGEFWELIFGPGILSCVVGSPFDVCSYIPLTLNLGNPPWCNKIITPWSLALSPDKGILGDPGAVSWAGRKSATKVFKHRRKSPWVLTLTRPFPKWSNECWLLIRHKKCFVLLCPIGEQHLLSSFCQFVHDGYWLDHGFSGSCTKEKQAVRKLSISKYCLPKN